MKKIFTILLGGLLTGTAFAGNITLSFSGNRNYQVTIDGRNVNASEYSNANTITLGNLYTGKHSIEVYSIKKKRWNGISNELVFSTSFDVSPRYNVSLVLDNLGSVKVYQTRNGRDRFSQPVSDFSFDILLQNISACNSDQLKSAEDALDNNYFTVAQERQIIQLFSFERDKVELAERAYKNTVDMENFKQIFKLVSLDGQQELNQYIRNFRS